MIIAFLHATFTLALEQRIADPRTGTVVGLSVSLTVIALIAASGVAVWFVLKKKKG